MCTAHHDTHRLIGGPRCGIGGLWPVNDIHMLATHSLKIVIKIRNKQHDNYHSKTYNDKALLLLYKETKKALLIISSGSIRCRSHKQKILSVRSFALRDFS